MNNSKKTALVGSECAGKTNNPQAVTEGLDLDIWMLKHKTRLYAEARSRRLIHLLLKIKENDPKHDVNGLLATCRKHARFTPRQAMYFASIVKLNNISVSPDLVPVSLSKASDRDQVIAMKDWEFQRLSEALSPRQQTICRKLRLGLVD
ncbi:MAG: hypothetical protein IBX55_23625 [Methyloprofundus sp.]|nr:hypothetical protein [Methyloprofundus sp.]